MAGSGYGMQAEFLRGSRTCHAFTTEKLTEMRLILAALLGMAAILSCSDEKGLNENGKESHSALPPPPGLNDNRTWSAADRETFLRACRAGLEGNIRARKICRCVLEKMERRYATLLDADEQGGETAGALAARECAGNIGYSEGLGNN